MANQTNRMVRRRHRDWTGLHEDCYGHSSLVSPVDAPLLHLTESRSLAVQSQTKHTRAHIAPETSWEPPTAYCPNATPTISVVGKLPSTWHLRKFSFFFFVFLPLVHVISLPRLLCRVIPLFIPRLLFHFQFPFYQRLFISLPLFLILIPTSFPVFVHYDTHSEKLNTCESPVSAVSISAGPIRVLSERLDGSTGVQGL